MLGLPVVRRCIDAIATDLASMPLELVRIGRDGSERLAGRHRAARLFQRSPDGGITTPMRFRQALVANMLAWGNGYAEIDESPDRNVVHLYILPPGSTAPYVPAEGGIAYRIDGKTVPKEKVVHLAGLGYDGLRGYSPIQLHTPSLSLSVTAERFGGSFLGNGAFASGYIKVAAGLDEAAYIRLRDRFIERHAEGVEKAGRVGVLPPGFEFQQASVDPEAAQFLETRQFQILEVCRIFGVPPHRVMDYSNMHYSTVEAVKLEFAQTTLLPWSRAVEEALNLRLLTDKEQAGGLTFRHDFTAFLRADAAARTAMNSAMFDRGIISGNQWAIEEGYPPYPGGEVHRVQLNTGSAAGQEPQPTADEPPADEEPQE